MYATSRGAKVGDLRWTNLPSICSVATMYVECRPAIRQRVRTDIDGLAERSCPGFERCGGSPRKGCAEERGYSCR